MANHTRHSTTSTHSFARRVAPFAPLALALAMHPAISGKTVTAPETASATTEELKPAQCEDVDDSEQCHAKYRAGCNSTARGYDTYLNFLKNTIDFSTATQPTKFISSLDQLQAKEQQIHAAEAKAGVKLAAGNHDQFKQPFKDLGEGSLQGVMGYLYALKAETGGSGETSNCKLKDDEADVDFHIFVGFDSDLAAKIITHPTLAKLSDKGKSMVVEMTPHFRAAFQPDWTSDLLMSVRGHKVKVVGQLMVDNDHNSTKDNCGLDGAGSTCWRASIWELHPVTKFQVCEAAGNDCDVNSSDWVDLEKLATSTTSTADSKSKKKKKTSKDAEEPD